MQILTGKLFKEMVLCGANTLHNNHPEIDALNVFPVPDGDTGTNMSMTFNAGAAEIKDMDSDNIYDIAKKLSKGLLMGARGNSGVILSQIFRGFAMGLEGHESVDAVIIRIYYLWLCYLIDMLQSIFVGYHHFFAYGYLT